MNPELTPANAQPRRLISRNHLIRVIASIAVLLLLSSNANAEIEEWRFQTSLYTKHWDPDPEHVNHQKLINFEFETTKRWIYGFAWFDNSFGQPSQYLYAGRSWPVMGSEFWYVKLTGGFLHGYKEPYEDKIPLNSLGVAPAIVPSVGFKYKRVFTELQILGTAAVTITGGFSFGHKSD